MRASTFETPFMVQASIFCAIWPRHRNNGPVQFLKYPLSEKYMTSNLFLEENVEILIINDGSIEDKKHPKTIILRS